jgi:hypothetical protein
LGIAARDAPGEEIVNALYIAAPAQLVRHRPAAHLPEQLWLGLSGRGRRENSGVKGVPPMGVHEAKRRQTIEPRVGHALDERVATVGLQGGAEFVDLGGLLPEFRRVRRQDVIEPCRNELPELVPGGLRESFEGGLVHSVGKAVEFSMLCEERFVLRE